MFFSTNLQASLRQTKNNNYWKYIRNSEILIVALELATLDRTTFAKLLSLSANPIISVVVLAKVGQLLNGLFPSWKISKHFCVLAGFANMTAADSSFYCYTFIRRNDYCKIYNTYKLS